MSSNKITRAVVLVLCLLAAGFVIGFFHRRLLWDVEQIHTLNEATMKFCTAIVVAAPFCRICFRRYLPMTTTCITTIVNGLLGGILTGMHSVSGNAENSFISEGLHLFFVGIAFAGNVQDVIWDAFVEITLAEERKQLEFESVRDATCSTARDELLIRDAINGREQHIDQTIHDLKLVGRYDTAVKANLARGMNPRRVLEGVKFRRLVVALIVSGTLFHISQGINYMAVSMGLLSCLLIVVYLRAGDHVIFAADAFFFAWYISIGVCFLSETVNRSIGLTRVYLALGVVALLASVMFYSGDPNNQSVGRHYGVHPKVLASDSSSDDPNSESDAYC